MRLEPCEFLNDAYSKPKLIPLAPNLRRLLDHSNAVARFTCTSVLLQATNVDRVKAISQAIAVASELLKLNNFSSFIAVCGAPMNTSIARLKSAFSVLPPGDKTTLDSFIPLLSSGPKYYRVESQAQGPVIPFLAHRFKELIYAKEIAQKITDADDRILFSKSSNRFTRR